MLQEMLFEVARVAVGGVANIALVHVASAAITAMTAASPSTGGAVAAVTLVCNEMQRYNCLSFLMKLQCSAVQ